MALEVSGDEYALRRDEAQCRHSLGHLANAGITVPINYAGGRWLAPTGTMTVQSCVSSQEFAAPLGVRVGSDAQLATVDRILPRSSGRYLQWSVPYRHPHRDALLQRLVAQLPGTRGYLFFAPADQYTAAGMLVHCVRKRARWWPATLAAVRSHCPLLAAEQGSVAMPFADVVVPPDTAWLPMSLNLTDFADRSGRIAQAHLERALDVALEEGDRILDQVAWPSQATSEDARVNRRIALRIDGIGDLVARAFNDPSSFSALRAMDALLGTVHAGLWRRSAALAAERGLLPALAERRPNPSWRDASHREAWTHRWQAAVSRVSVRHRNLLVLTADSLLPRRAPAHPGYADLLPLLAHADAVGISLNNLPRDWERLDLTSFHARLQAQISRLNATSFVAIGA